MENPNFERILQGQDIDTATRRVEVLPKLGIGALDATTRVARQAAVGTGVGASEIAARHGTGIGCVQGEICIAHIVIALNDVDFAIWIAVVVYCPAGVQLVKSTMEAARDILGWPDTTRSCGHVLKVRDKDTAAKSVFTCHTHRVATRI